MSELKEAIKAYYTDTQFEYKLIWNWGLSTTPALHFGYYDEKARSHQQAIVRANEVLADFAGIKPGSKVVDAGCGLGHSSEWLANFRHCHVTGITLVPLQVDTIIKRLKKQPVANVQFMVADYLSMPFDNASVDVVWAVESVCHAPQKIEFFKEAFRVLKPGGVLAISDYVRRGRPMEEDDEKLLQKVFGAWAVPDIDTAEEYSQHAQQAGFSEFKYRNVTPHMLQSYRNLRKTCQRYYKLSALLKNTGIISSMRHKNMQGSLQQADALEKGVFSYHQMVAIK